VLVAPTVTVALDAGGADTYTSRAIRGTYLHLGCLPSAASTVVDHVLTAKRKRGLSPPEVGRKETVLMIRAP